jgi:hypothetical protein
MSAEFPPPQRSWYEQGVIKISLTKSVPKYLHQMSVAGRLPPGTTRGAAGKGKARSQTPGRDAVEQALPEADHGLGQMHDQTLRVFGHAATGLQDVIAKTCQVPTATHRILQFGSQRVAQVESQQGSVAS